MKIEIAKVLSNVERIDLLSGYFQIFQDPPPNISHYIVKNGAADVFLIPHDAMHWTHDYRRFVSSLTQEKPVIFFNRGDYPVRIELKNAYSIQNVFSRNNTATILAPYNVINLGLRNLREHKQEPTISFVGFVPKLLSRRLLRFDIRTLLNPFQNSSAIVRRFGTHNLKRQFSNSEVITRNHYGGSSRLIEDPTNFRENFVRSIHNSDLVFSPRGDANGSQRFFETLSAGRIPIFPRTGIRIPLLTTIEPEMTYLCCSTLSFDISEVVMSWWSNITNSEFKDMQLNNHQIYRDKLDYRKFMINFFDSDVSILKHLAEVGIR